MRYSGCPEMDINQLFVKKQGIYLKLHTIAHPTRLTLLYELAPLSFLIEKSNGKATDGHQTILDIPINNPSLKLNFFAGSSEDVDYITGEMNEDAGNVSGKKGSYQNLIETQNKIKA